MKFELSETEYRRGDAIVNDVAYLHMETGEIEGKGVNNGGGTSGFLFECAFKSSHRIEGARRTSGGKAAHNSEG